MANKYIMVIVLFTFLILVFTILFYFSHKKKKNMIMTLKKEKKLVFKTLPIYSRYINKNNEDAKYLTLIPWWVRITEVASAVVILFSLLCIIMLIITITT